MKNKFTKAAFQRFGIFGKEILNTIRTVLPLITLLTICSNNIIAQKDEELYYDERSPLNYVEFKSRTTVKSIATLKAYSNASYEEYIKPNWNIVIHFDSDAIDLIKKKYPNFQPKLKIEAKITNPKNEAKSISIEGYSDVENTYTSVSGFVGNILSGQKIAFESVDSFDKLITTEINIQEEKLLIGDQIIILITDTAHNLSFSKKFIVEDFGWTQAASASMAFVKSNSINFNIAPQVGYGFYYKSEPNATFGEKLFSPSFGPSVVALSNSNSDFTFGLGGQISILARTVTIGVGSFLNQPNNFNDRLYFSIGVNFLEGFESFKALTKNSSK